MSKRISKERLAELEKRCKVFHAKWANELVQALKAEMERIEELATLLDDCKRGAQQEQERYGRVITKFNERIEAALDIVEWLTDLHDDMHEYGGQTWSKQLAPKLDKLREALTGGKDESR